MIGDLPKTALRDDVDPDVFRNDILPAAQPVILKGLVDRWPVVAAAKEGDTELQHYLKRFDNGRPVETLLGAPSIEGRFFYTDGLRGVNFSRRQAKLSAAVDELFASKTKDNAPSIYIQSAPIAQHLPGFAEENALSIIAGDVAPRIWIGNRLTVQTHFDLSQNVACVVAGRKRFTLFPPEQIANLYPGPLEMTLSGPPVSMVQLHNPDFETYPRFHDALAAAQVAELEPGDALFVPYHWWHHVESLDEINILVNYWWNETAQGAGSPRDCLLHGLLSLRTLPPREREIWRHVLDYYVFESDGDPAAHLPPDRRGILGEATPELLMQMRMMLTQALVEFAKKGVKR